MESHCNWQPEAGLSSQELYFEATTAVPGSGTIEKRDLLDLITPKALISNTVINALLYQINQQCTNSLYFADTYLLERWNQLLAVKYNFKYNDGLLFELPKGKTQTFKEIVLTLTGLLQLDTDFFTRNEAKLFSFFDKERMCTSDRLVFPIHYNGNHWTLMEINFTNRKITHFDGCPGERHRFYAQTLVNMLETYYTVANHPRKSIGMARWASSNSLLYPTQTGGTDCGIFLLQGALAIAFKDNIFDWTMEDINYLRKFYGSCIQQLAQGVHINFQRLFDSQINIIEQQIEENSIQETILIKPHIVSPIKNRMQKIYQSLSDSATQSDLIKYPVIDLIAWSILTRIKFCKVDSKHHTDYRKHIDWILDNIDDWPDNILESIPQLRKAYLHVLLQWDLNEATGNTRTDLGMMLICFTLKCCQSKSPCILSLMFSLQHDQQLWKSKTQKERNNWILLKATKTVIQIEGGKYQLNASRTSCCRSWQALYGVTSDRLNSVIANKKTVQTKTAVWEEAVHKVSTQQLEEFNHHLLSVLLPNPFAPRGLNQNLYVCPPHISSYHQLYLHYVWQHIRKCKE